MTGTTTFTNNVTMNSDVIIHGNLYITGNLIVNGTITTTLTNNITTSVPNHHEYLIEQVQFEPDNCKQKLNFNYPLKELISSMQSDSITSSNSIYDNLPEIPFDDLENHIQYNLENDCPICCELLSKETIIVLDCGHYYHKTCMSKWIKLTNKCASCPTCRKKIEK
jgi:hypothetical protein